MMPNFSTGSDLPTLKPGKFQRHEVLQRSEALDGTQFDIHFDLALVLLQQNESGAAADELEKAIKLQPSHALAHVLLGRAYQNTNRTLQAIRQFQSCVADRPGYSAWALSSGIRLCQPRTQRGSYCRV